MKPVTPAPRQPNGTPYESLDQRFRAVIAIPKAEIDRLEEEWKQEHGTARNADASLYRQNVSESGSTARRTNSPLLVKTN